MKKISAILFLSICLLSSNRVNELLKRKVLVQHCYETNDVDNSDTFFRFLFMNYLSVDLSDKESNRDKQLPLKSTEACSSGSASLYLPCNNIRLLIYRTSSLYKRVFFQKNSFTLPSNHHPAWHPPKYS